MIKASLKPPLQSILHNHTGRKVAVVVDLIGPVDNFYIVAKTLIESPQKLVGAKLYIEKEMKRS